MFQSAIKRSPEGGEGSGSNRNDRIDEFFDTPEKMFTFVRQNTGFTPKELTLLISQLTSPVSPLYLSDDKLCHRALEMAARELSISESKDLGQEIGELWNSVVKFTRDARESKTEGLEEVALRVERITTRRMGEFLSSAAPPVIRSFFAGFPPTALIRQIVNTTFISPGAYSVIAEVFAESHTEELFKESPKQSISALETARFGARLLRILNEDEQAKLPGGEEHGSNPLSFLSSLLIGARKAPPKILAEALLYCPDIKAVLIDCFKDFARSEGIEPLKAASTLGQFLSGNFPQNPREARIAAENCLSLYLLSRYDTLIKRADQDLKRLLIDYPPKEPFKRERTDDRTEFQLVSEAIPSVKNPALLAYCITMVAGENFFGFEQTGNYFGEIYIRNPQHESKNPQLEAEDLQLLLYVESSIHDAIAMKNFSLQSEGRRSHEKVPTFLNCESFLALSNALRTFVKLLTG